MGRRVERPRAGIRIIQGAARGCVNERAGTVHRYTRIEDFPTVRMPASRGVPHRFAREVVYRLQLHQMATVPPQKAL